MCNVYNRWRRKKHSYTFKVVVIMGAVWTAAFSIKLKQSKYLTKTCTVRTLKIVNIFFKIALCLHQKSTWYLLSEQPHVKRTKKQCGNGDHCIVIPARKKSYLFPAIGNSEPKSQFLQWICTSTAVVKSALEYTAGRLKSWSNQTTVEMWQKAKVLLHWQP